MQNDYKTTDYQFKLKKEMKRLSNQCHADYMGYSDNDEDSGDDLADPIQHTAPSATSKRISDKLQMWYKHYKPPAECINSLLQILNDEGLNVSVAINGSAGDCFKDNNSAVIAVQEEQKQMNAKIHILMREIAKVNLRIDEKTFIKSDNGRNNLHPTEVIYPMENITDFDDCDDEFNTDNIEYIVTLFPIMSEETLGAINTKICDKNWNLYVTTVSDLLSNDLNTSLKKVLSDEIVLSFNIDGTHGKKGLKNFPNIFKIILAAIETLPINGNPDELLRRAFQVQKKRHFRKVCYENKISNNYKS